MAMEDGSRSQFCGTYAVGDNVYAITQKVTPIRETVEAVVIDLVAVRRRERSLRFAQIIDLTTLEPIESPPRTLARLGESV
jgi:hypothetical protein